MTDADFLQIQNFLEDPQLKDLLQKVEEDRKKFEESHFNIFSLVSDQYRKENLQSDILAEFLNPQGRHGQGNVFLMEFIKLVNTKAQEQKVKFELNENAFESASVVREEGRIDVLIKGENEAIIFENKINNAGDTARQLPDYFQLIRGKGYSKIMIVYMPYRAGTPPEEKGWQQGDAKVIYPSLVLFNAFEQGKHDLREGLIARWLEIATVKNASMLLQYSELLKMIGGQAMSDKTNSDIFNFFMSEQMGGDRIKAAFLVQEYINRGLLIEIVGKVKAGIVLPQLADRNAILKDLRKIGGGFKQQEGYYQLVIQNFVFTKVYLIIYIRFYLKETGLSSELIFQTYDEKTTGDQLEVLSNLVNCLSPDLGLEQDENYSWRWVRKFDSQKQHEEIIDCVNLMIANMMQIPNK
jgi:hypothetical protein